MLYLNQLKYPDMPYPTDIDNPGSPMIDASVAKAGCGLCSLAMVIDRLTMQSVSLKELIELSKEYKANLQVGTNMRVLAPEIARLYDLDYSTTEDIAEAVKCLQSGGIVIANVGGDREGYTGVFSHGGHYILLLCASGNDICVLDPSLKEGKYEEEGRSGKVRLDGSFAWCDASLLAVETDNRSPGFYLFSRKIPK